MEDAEQEALFAVDLARSAGLHVSELTCASADSCRVCNNNNNNSLSSHPAFAPKLSSLKMF